LALRLARAHTRWRDVVVLEHAYHGNTTTMIDVSPYKHAGPGGEGAPPWVHVAPLPDLYRGAFRRDDPAASRSYVRSVENLIDEARVRGTPVGAFLAESWPSVGGQLSLPDDYLRGVYAAVRSGGGICIADEVQTSLGRLGDHFWGFEYYGVVPDIVVLGKPIGNGHPIAAVVTTAEIAASFDNGMEFFSTFGGNPVSCAIGLAVLDTVADQQLQSHARAVGQHLLAELAKLKDRHSLIGEVRGSGLFLGVELVTDRQSLDPAGREASWIANWLRNHGVLLGTDGPYHSVLKIRPPMPFDRQDADLLIQTLDEAFVSLASAGAAAP
jgi:4-aminobutyrate aminotransferase-like enzyme